MKRYTKNIYLLLFSVFFLAGCTGTTSVGVGVYGGYGYPSYGYGGYYGGGYYGGGYYRPPYRPNRPNRPNRPRPEHPIHRPDRPTTLPSRPTTRPSARPSGNMRSMGRPSGMRMRRR